MDDIVQQLRDENDRLRERIRQLTDDLAPAVDVPIEYGLTATEARLFAHLTTRTRATKRGLYAAAYAHLTDEWPDESTVESHLSRLRRKVAPFGWQLRSERFAGYWIERGYTVSSDG